VKRLFSPLGLTLLALLALLPGIWELPLMDRDEPRFAHATVEMKERGEWVVPYFNDEYRFDKPPLTYWWMRANFELFGINEFSARLHSVQSSWRIALVLFLFAGGWGSTASWLFWRARAG
jgi:4-amino-4-deoxy-L-arabinose transferase-like glycosyltransferase